MQRITAAEARRLGQSAAANPRVKQILEDLYQHIAHLAANTQEQSIERGIEYFAGLSSTDTHHIANVFRQDGYMVSQDGGIMTISWARAL